MYSILILGSLWCHLDSWSLFVSDFVFFFSWRFSLIHLLLLSFVWDFRMCMCRLIGREVNRNTISIRYVASIQHSHFLLRARLFAPYRNIPTEKSLPIDLHTMPKTVNLIPTKWIYFSNRQTDANTKYRANNVNTEI